MIEQDPADSAEPTVRLPIEQVRDGRRTALEDLVVVEQTISIVINGRAPVRLQCLPGREVDLAVGFLVTEGLVSLPAQLRAADFDQAGPQAAVTADVADGVLDAFERGAGVGSGCGRGIFSSGEMDALECDRKLDMTFGMDATTVLDLMREFRDRSGLFEQTGGVHAAGLVWDGRIADFAEDIGRHNAVDKVVGAAFRVGRDLEHAALLVSGRLSLEMVLKAVRARIPIVISRSAPTAPAVELAQRFHVGLAGFARGGRINLYAAAWRIRT